MGDNLGEIENKILDSIYCRDYEKDFDIKINTNCFPLTENDENKKSHEAGYYLERLRRLNYLDFKDKALIRADGEDPKYKNNIIMIWWEDIHISYKGKRYVEEYRKNLSDKILESSKKFIADIGREMRNKIVSHLATFILGIFAAYLYYVLFLK